MIGLLVATMAVVAAAPTDDPPPDAPSVADDTVSVIVTLDPDATRTGSPLQMRALGQRVIDGLAEADVVGDVERFATVPAMVVEVSPDAVADLESQPGVVDVSPNRQFVPFLADSTQLIGADDAWNAGHTGAGSTIAVVDTGVDRNHPMLSGKLVAEGCFKPGGPATCPGGQSEGLGVAAPCIGDNCNHGTIVANVAAGNGSGLRGVANGASVIAAQVFSSAVDADKDGSLDGLAGTDEGAIIRALEWVYSKRSAPGIAPIAVVNLSLGTINPVPTPCSGTPALTSVIDLLTSAGIAVVFASGNAGSSSRLAYPACLPNVVSVGSIDNSRVVSSFSNTAPSLTLLAPGRDITVGASSVEGTSFSAPHVAGAIAILRSQLGAWPVSSLVSLLDRTGDPTRAFPGGPYLQAATINLTRAIQPQYQAVNPAALPQATGPIGTLDVVASAAGGLRVAGWALDPDAVTPVTVHVYVDGVLVSDGGAHFDRADLAAAFPGYGTAHAYDILVPVGDGGHVVCAYGINVAAGSSNSLLGCRTATTGAVIGSLDVASTAIGVASVGGWTLDTATAASTAVHVYADGALVASGLANVSRPDIAAAFPGYGAAHGFNLTFPLSGGVHSVCVYAIEVGTAVNNPNIGCRLVLVPTGPPFGSLDVAKVVPGGIEVGGWAIDPDTAASLEVHVYMDGVLVSGAGANVNRPDLAAVFPAYGPFHGFSRAFSAGGGAHQVCAFAINVGGGSNASLGCRDVVVPDGSPFGSLDVARNVAGGVEVGGWAIDPDAPTTALEVHIYVDGVVAGGAGANVNRPDIAAVFPTSGPFHGYSRVVPAGPGAHTVCVYAINVAGGSNKALGCATT